MSFAPRTSTEDLSGAIIWDPHCLPGSARVQDAHHLICQQLTCPLSSDQHTTSDSGCVLVVENNQLQGIVTVRDLLQLIAAGVDSQKTLLQEVMSTPVLSLRQQEFENLFGTIQLMRRRRIRHLPIVNDRNQPLGVATLSSLRRQLKQSSFLRFRQVAEVMSTQVVSVTAQTALSEVIAIMSKHAISCVVIAEPAPPSEHHEDARDALIPLGVITEREILQLQMLHYDHSQLKAEQLLGHPPTCVGAEETLSSIHQLMTERAIGHVVVTNEQKHLQGLVTETDVTDTIDPVQSYAINQILRKQVERLRDERDQLLAGQSLNLQQAINSDEIRLVYQPVLDLQSGQITGVEALLRWRPQSQGEISPSIFIPLAEQTHTIHRLGDWILDTACRQLLAWRNEGVEPGSLNINISAQQLIHPEFVQRTLRVVNQHGIAPGAIQLELTETALVDNFSTTAATLATLQQHGFRIAIDDFGSGYASLAYIQHFSIDSLKLDQSFIKGLSQRPRNQAIVGAVMELARQLNYQLVVEGVESEEELMCLRAMNYPMEIQGYAISRPLEASSWSSFITSHTGLSDLLHNKGRADSNTASGAIHIASP